MAKTIYFDNNATTPIAPEVFDAMKLYLMSEFGNPSSVHHKGRDAGEAVAGARKAVSSLIGSSHPNEVFFTSGGTESDNWAIRGALAAFPDKKHIISTRVEHDAIKNPCLNLARLGYEINFLDVDSDGSIDLDDLKSALRADTALVSIMWANNETGVIMPVKEAANIVKENSSAVFHTDAVNAAGKVAIDVEEAGVDLLSISGHKMHAPKGIGALYIRKDSKFEPLIRGGGQEHGLRAGTEPVHQIVAFGAAAKLAAENIGSAHVRELRDRLEDGLLASIPYAYLNGTTDRSLRVPNTASISFENINGEIILSRLDDLGVCVSTGSACSSAHHSASAVLEAMNIPYSRAMGSIRFSLSRYNTVEEVDLVLEELPRIISSLRAVSAGAEA